MKGKNNLYCKICGLYQIKPEFFWGEDGNTPSFDICDCCGVEFGNEDYIVKSIKEYRKNWLNKGAEWFNPEQEPSNWDLKEQMKNIPKKYF